MAAVLNNDFKFFITQNALRASSFQDSAGKPVARKV
jgi:hypothetical protein